MLRNINADPVITITPLKYKITKEHINYKARAFADKVDVFCKNDITSIQAVFSQYEKLTKRSGLELNADKNEILSLKSNRKLSFNDKPNLLCQRVDRLPV